MTKKISIQEKLEKLESIAGENITEIEVTEIRKALSSSSNIITSKAAKLIGRYRIRELIPEMVNAFNRLMETPTRTDKGCLSKISIIASLEKLNYDDSSPFLAGVRHEQWEPVWGGSVDVAAELRAKCALALARLEESDLFFILTRLLVDHDPQPRVAAVRALTYFGDERSELLLRLKVLTGDANTQILQECFSSLMEINSTRSLEFVAGFLDSADLRVAESAALAIGESKSPGAFTILREYWDKSCMVKRDYKEMLLLPIALTRSDEAFEFLVEQLRHEHPEIVIESLKALKIFEPDENKLKRICEAVGSRKNQIISKAFHNIFPQ